MLLSVAERLLLLNVLPPGEGDFLFIRSLRTFRESLSFSDEEVAEIGLTRIAGGIKWDQGKNPMKDIHMGPSVAAYVSKSIQAARSLREDHVEFYSRFVVDSPPEE